MFLILAIGLVMAAPVQGSEDEVIIKRLKFLHYDQAELFFRSAQFYGDPRTGFEDADFMSVQALLLMAVYMLAVSKRNAAYLYHGKSFRPLVKYSPN